MAIFFCFIFPFITNNFPLKKTLLEGVLVTNMEHVKRSKMNVTDHELEILVHNVEQNRKSLFDSFRIVCLINKSSE